MGRFAHMVHPISASGFGSDADRYERGRPGYPTVALADLPLATPILDLAAGTGKLTRVLADLAAPVFALEPSAEMRRVLAQQVPSVPLVAGVAERLPFADGSLGTITVAQAFRWFDHSRAWDEFRRVLRRGGAFVLVENGEVGNEPWLEECMAIRRRIEDGVGRPPNWHELSVPSESVEGFDGPHLDTFENPTEYDRTRLLDRFGSMSVIASLPDEERVEALDAIGAVFDRQGRDSLVIRFLTRRWVWRRR